MSSEYIQFIILYVLYDKFESDGSIKWLKATELIDNDELNYLNSSVVTAEIDYLAGKKFISGGSPTGYSPYSQLQITSDGIEIIRFIMKNYPIYLNNMEDEECKLKYKQISAMQSVKGKRLEIYGFIKRKANYFEDFLEKTNAISLTPTPFNYVVL